LNLSYFISKKITRGQKEGFASSIHTIAMLTIGIGLAASIVSFLIMKGFQETVKNKIFSFSGHLVMTKPSMNNSPEEPGMNYQIDMYKNKAEYPYIRHIQEYAHKAGLVKTEDEVVGLIIKGVGKSFNQEAFSENMVEGEFVHFPDSGYSNEVVLSRTIANTLQAHVGDEFVVHFFQTPPRFRKLKVSGIYETNLSEYFDSKIILADIRLIQRLNNWQDSIAGGLEVMIQPNAFRKAELLDEHLQYEMSYEEEGDENIFKKGIGFVAAFWSFDYETAVIEKAAQEILIVNNYEQQVQLIEERYLQVFEWLNLISRQVNILLGIIVIVICVNMISIVLILVMERTQMIGMLKALGAKDGLIRSIFIYNGVQLIIKGLVLGNVLGIGLCYLQHRFRIIKLNPKDYYMAFVPISWHWDLILLLNLLTLAVVTAVLLIPTMVITRIDPIKAIRFD
jgi:lipoprotein-releasing system permease protein